MIEEYKKKNPSDTKTLDLFIDYLNYYGKVNLSTSYHEIIPFISTFYIDSVNDATKKDLMNVTKTLLNFYKYMYEKQIIDKKTYDHIPTLLKEGYNKGIDNLKDLYGDLRY